MIISILAWIFSLVLNFKSWLPLEIKNCCFTFLDSCLKSRKFENKSWFLTAEILELFRILDSCLTPFLKISNSWFLSRPIKLNLALLWLKYQHMKYEWNLAEHQVWTRKPPADYSRMNIPSRSFLHINV